MAKVRLAATPRPFDARTKLMRAIRAACRRTGIDDDERKAIQAERVGKASMSDMSFAELGQLLDHLNRDWQGSNGDRSHLGKIRALWWSLYWLGEVSRSDEAALEAFVKRQTGVERLRFLDFKSAPAVIEALKSWLGRAGVQWWTDADMEPAVVQTAGNFTAAHADRHAVFRAIVRRLKDRHLLNENTGYLYLAGVVGKPPLGDFSYSTSDLDAGIRALGRKLRAAIEQERDGGAG